MSDETSIIRTIGRYHALEELGRGGMGIVYRAFDPVIGRTVALKTIGFTIQGDEAKALRERLFREAAAAGTLTHPNIVTVYDILEDGPSAAVAMEFVEGQTLAALIAGRGPLALDRALDLFEQICAALDYAGQRGIVHRDVKPANVLITSDGRAKITDFGIARLMTSGLTQTSTIMGSPSYMSPEQVRGLPLDPRSDLFSAAAVLYEMLTGERPFAGDDVATTMYHIVNEPPRAVEQFNPTIGPAVSAVLSRALSKNPNDRYQTGTEFVAELRRAVGTGTQPAVAMPVLQSLPAKKRSPLLIVAVSGGALVLLLIALIIIGSSDEPESEAQPAPERAATAVPQTLTEAAPPVTIPEAPATPAPYSGPVSTVPAPTRATRPAASTAGRLPTASADRAARSGAAAVPAGQPLQGNVAARAAIEPAVTAPRESAAPAVPSRESAGLVPPAVAPPAPPQSTAVALPPAQPPTVVLSAQAPAPPPVPPVAAPPAPPPATPKEATLQVAFEGPPYPVTLFAGDVRIGRADGPGPIATVEAGSLRLRAVNEALFLNADLGFISVRPGERRTLVLPGTGSAVLGVRGEDYAGVRILLDGRQVPGPYPAQIARLATGEHQVTYRWISGPRVGREIASTLRIVSGGHFLVRAVLDNDQVVVQQLR